MTPDAVPSCPKRKLCGGCQYIHLPYAEQLARKQARLDKLLGRFCRVEPICAMERPYHYRGKVQAAFGTGGRGRIISGVYQSGSHRIVSVDDCLLEDETADRIIVDIRNMMPRFKLTAYDEKRASGFLRHVLVRRSPATGERSVSDCATMHSCPTFGSCSRSASDIVSPRLGWPAAYHWLTAG